MADQSWRYIVSDPGLGCWTGKDGMVLLISVGNAEVYGWAPLIRSQLNVSSTDGLYRMSRGLPERVRGAFSDAVAQPHRLHHSPRDEVRLDRWHVAIPVLIRDVAHAIAPVWAKGAALGIDDAIVLAASLPNDRRLQIVLEFYEDRRQNRVAPVLTDAMSKAAKLPPYIRSALLPSSAPSDTGSPLTAEGVNTNGWAFIPVARGGAPENPHRAMRMLGASTSRADAFAKLKGY